MLLDRFQSERKVLEEGPETRCGEIWGRAHRVWNSKLKCLGFDKQATLILMALLIYKEILKRNWKINKTNELIRHDKYIS